MADADEDAIGFGGADEEEEDVGGFGGADEEEDDDTGFGDNFDEDAEEGGFGDLEEDEDLDEDGAGWGNADDEEVPDVGPKKAAGGSSMDMFEKDIAAKFFNKGTDGKYTIEPIKTPLLKLSKGKADKACEMFKLVCQFLGITARVGKSTLGAVPAAQAITRFGIADPDFREELYCQLLKQMNGNPAASSRARGVILFTLVMGTFPCSQKLLPIVDAFIREGPKGYQSYCNLTLRRCIHNGPRNEPPCRLEFEAVKRKQIMRVRVITDLVTQDTVTARLDAASVMSEWVQEIGAKLGLKDTYGWSIYVNRSGRLKSLRGAGLKGLHVMDVISKIDQDSKESSLDITKQLSFRKELFAKNHNSLADERSTHIICNQIRSGFKDSSLTLKDDEYNEVFAILFYSDFFDKIDEKTLIEYLEFWLPANAKKSKSPKDRAASVERIHAKSEYSKRKFTKVQAQDLVIKYALSKFGTCDFAPDGSMRLQPNGRPGPGPKKSASKRGKK
mmetsp:Transcript_14872/g.38121  ORF Transcript_14872/g.38121 Transcript_14872/m.38121 type:complete len:502 (+) Transcript_14872:62-1567(+)